MRYYIATLETSDYTFESMPDNYIEYGLVSFLYLKNDEQFELILRKCKKILIDSGAFTFQRDPNKDINVFIEDYINFIKKYTHNNQVVGFFEMDIDNIVGYEKVKEYRSRLEHYSDKIVPVWHKERGVEEYVKMCQDYSGKLISVTGMGNDDIEDSQYNLFINTAHKFGCNFHILGMTRYSLLKNLNLHENDSFDSSSWKQTAIFGCFMIPNKEKEMTKFDVLCGMKIDYKILMNLNLIMAVKLQKTYIPLNNSIYFKKGGNNERFE